jgi:hypothetical protein
VSVSGSISPVQLLVAKCYLDLLSDPDSDLDEIKRQQVPVQKYGFCTGYLPRVSPTIHLSGATTMPQEKPSSGTGKSRQHRRGAFPRPTHHQPRRPRAEGWSSQIGSRRSRPMGSASDWSVCKA